MGMGWKHLVNITFMVPHCDIICVGTQPKPHGVFLVLFCLKIYSYAVICVIIVFGNHTITDSN